MSVSGPGNGDEGCGGGVREWWGRGGGGGREEKQRDDDKREEEDEEVVVEEYEYANENEFESRGGNAKTGLNVLTY